MKNRNKSKKSIWGNWWEPFRKWVYPSWLLYEISLRFFNYEQTVHSYFEKHHFAIVPFIGKFGAEAIGAFLGTVTFAFCTIFLTVPACFVLFKFFNEENLTSTRFEEKMKILF